MVTAYDFTMARLMDEAGVDVILVGDSLGMVIQGLATTLPVTLDEICYHGRAVARASARAHVVGDMPFMSYQVSREQAVESAGKLRQGGGLRGGEARGGRRDRRARAAHRPRGRARDGSRGAPAAERSRARRLQDAGPRRRRGGEDRRRRARSRRGRGVRHRARGDSARTWRGRSRPRLACRPSASARAPAATGRCSCARICLECRGGTRQSSRSTLPRSATRSSQATARYVAEVRAGAFPSAEHAFKPNRADEAIVDLDKN